MIGEINFSMGIENVKRIIIVSSGKGGVGKSTVASYLAMFLWKQNYSVGLLDIDLCGPSIPHILGVKNNEVKRCNDGWLPVYADVDDVSKNPKMTVMSIGFLLSSPTDSVVWRGAKKNSMIESLLNQVYWGSLDYLVIDTPPGTSDEKITLASIIKAHHMSRFAGTVIVTTPQMIALSDVRKDISFYQKVELPILGLIENMSGLRCPNCGNIDRVFSTGGGQSLAAARNITFLGSLPLLPDIARKTDTNETFSEKSSSCLTESIFCSLMSNIDSLVTRA